jgi:hypothetical protein
VTSSRRIASTSFNLREAKKRERRLRRTPQVKGALDELRECSLAKATTPAALNKAMEVYVLRYDAVGGNLTESMNRRLRVTPTLRSFYSTKGTKTCRMRLHKANAREAAAIRRLALDAALPSDAPPL